MTNKPKSPNLTKITINLKARTTKALQVAVKETGDSRTDIINRAVLVYAIIVQVQNNGGDLYIQPKPEDKPQPVRFLS